MKHKTFKYKSDLFDQEITLIVDDNLNKFKGRILAPEKLEEANKSLRRLQHLIPKQK